MHPIDHTATDLPDEAATLAFGAALAPFLAAVPGLVVWLEGDLGAGKTTLVRGLLRALGDTGPVKSPTYTLVELHVISGLDLYHFDFYRFNQPEEYLDAGLDEYFAGHGICMVEWPDRARPYLPDADLVITLELSGEGRRVRVEACTPRGLPCLRAAASPGGTSSAPPAPG